MEEYQIKRDRGRPEKKLLRETIKNDLELMSWILIWFMIELYRVL